MKRLIVSKSRKTQILNIKNVEFAQTNAETGSEDIKSDGKCLPNEGEQNSKISQKSKFADLADQIPVGVPHDTYWTVSYTHLTLPTKRIV